MNVRAKRFTLITVAALCASGLVRAELEKEHPGICVRESALPTLRKKSAMKGTASQMWDDVEKAADAALLSTDVQNGPSAGDMTVCAFAWLISEKEEYAEFARRTAIAITDEPVWRDPTEFDDFRTMANRRFAGSPVPSFNYTDTVTAEYTLNLALVYDWMYGEFTPDERVRIRAALIEKGIRPAIEDAANGIWWAERWHSRGASIMSAIGVGGLSLFGEEDDAPEWVSTSKQWISTYVQNQGKDGGWQDGFAGWTDGLGSTLVFLEALRSRLGDTDIYRNPHLSATLDFGIYGTMPDKTGIIDFGPVAYETAYRTVHVNLRLAAQYKNKVAQWNAIQVWRANREGQCDGSTTVWNFLWFESSVGTREPQAYDAARHFRGIDWAVMRTGWREKFVLLAVRGGAPNGPLRAGDPGNMMFGAYGRPVLVTDTPSEPGAADGTYNCVYLDGTGPRPGVWDSPDNTSSRLGRILDFRNGRGYNYVLADATDAYDGTATRVHRHVIFIEPEYIVIIDDVVSERPVRFEQRWHTVDGVEVKDGYAELVHGAVRLRVESQTADGTAIEPDAGEGAVPHAVVKPSDRVTARTVVTVLTPGYNRTRSYHPQIVTTENGFSIELKRNRWRDTITCTRGVEQLEIDVDIAPALRIPERTMRRTPENTERRLPVIAPPSPQDE